ncbi:ABC transporter substrate-binding protein [Mesorhizobium sp. CCNWLW179-1]|uniref:ABC transporter substrate-binding protein n=1 Tax=unclassified Mesorhizobium TaxID=325217 RepID=UPI00301489A3
MLTTSGAALAQDWPAAFECKPLAETEDVTVGIALSLSIATPLQAEGAGRYAEQNLEVDTQVFKTSQDAVALVAAGQLDVMIGGLSANIFNGIASGLPLAVVAANGHFGTEPPSGFFVRSELLDSGEVKTMADLKGRTVAFPGAAGSGAAYFAEIMLEQGQLGYADIKHANLGYADMQVAFENGAIDAGWVTSPYMVPTRDSGAARLFGDLAVAGNQTAVGILFGEALLKERPEAPAPFCVRTSIRRVRIWHPATATNGRSSSASKRPAVFQRTS